MTSTVAAVEVASGVLLAVLPGELGTHHLGPLRRPEPAGDPS